MVLGIVVSFGGRMLRAAPPAAEKPAKPPACRVAVDPRVELMCIIFRLAGHREYNLGTLSGYNDDVTKAFGPFVDHAVIKLVRKLRGTRGISYDAPMSMAVTAARSGRDERRSVSDALAEDPRFAVDERRLAGVRGCRCGTSSRTPRSRSSSINTASCTSRPSRELRTLLDKQAHLEWFDALFRRSAGGVFCRRSRLLNGPCNYGTRRELADGREELYCILGVWYADEEGKPKFSGDQVSTIVHEFCHSYANPIIDRHAAELQAAGEKIFPAVAGK